MRDFINIVKNITEAKSEIVEVGENDVRVWLNPTHPEFMRLISNFRHLRGIIEAPDDLYVWDAANAIHHSIEAALGIQSLYNIMMESSEVALEYGVDEDEFKSLPCIRRAYGNLDFDIINDSIFGDDEDY